MDDAAYFRRLLSKVTVADDGCWLYAFVQKSGYSRVFRGAVHRLVFEFFNGPIPDGLEIDHLCRNRACCNPEHLEPVTHAENLRRSAPAQKTHCKHGHEFTDENTYRSVTTGRRACRRCHAKWAQQYRRAA